MEDRWSNQSKNDNDDVPLIPTYLFKTNKRFVLFKLSFCQKNEIK